MVLVILPVWVRPKFLIGQHRSHDKQWLFGNVKKKIKIKFLLLKNKINCVIIVSIKHAVMYKMAS